MYQRGDNTMGLTGEQILLVILIVNAAGAIGYYIWGRVTLSQDKVKCAIYAIVMLMCPVVGILFFALGYGMYRAFFHQNVDLEDVVFSKEKAVAHTRADEERERNMVPIEEALAVSDKESLRMLMMNVLKGDIQKSLASIALALNSEDSEASHYAASVLRDELNDFRTNVQKTYNQMKEAGKEKSEYCCMLLEYMNSVLAQQVFTPMEQNSYVKLMADVGENLFECDFKRLTSKQVEWIALRALEIKDYELCEHWCRRAREEFPESLATYTCQLKLYFTTQNKQKFFAVMDQLKKSQIVIDKETLELIRIFE